MKTKLDKVTIIKIAGAVLSVAGLLVTQVAADKDNAKQLEDLVKNTITSK